MARSPARAFHSAAIRLGRLAAAIARGDAAAIHDARVLARRSRELLPLCTRCVPPCHIVERRLRKLVDLLGPIRDLDVELALLTGLEERVPKAAGVLAARRRVVKRTRVVLLAQLAGALDPLLGEPGTSEREGPSRAVETHPAWRLRLKTRLARRQARAIAGIARATRLRFGRRLHRARIAIKKLRYIAETADAFGLLADRTVVRRLRRAQRQLGEIHDRQLLAGALRRVARSSGAKGLDPALREIDRRIRIRYDRYVARRSVLLDACRAIALRPD